MSGETEANVSGWTTDTLSEHVQRMLADQLILFKEVGSHYAQEKDVAILQAKVDAIADLMEAKFVTFRVLVESQAEKVALALAVSEKAILKAEEATAKAIDKAEEAGNNRFAAINEFRQSLTDQQRTFITRLEVDAAIERGNERITDVAARLDRAERS
jgi:hypothetical protein